MSPRRVVVPIRRSSRHINSTPRNYVVICSGEIAPRPNGYCRDMSVPSHAFGPTEIDLRDLTIGDLLREAVREVPSKLR